jgi:hypothetical protein
MLHQIKASLETPLRIGNLNVATPCDLSIGLNMCKEEMVELKSLQIPDNENDFAERLEEIYGTIREKAA